MDVIAFIFALFAIATATTCNSKIKILERRIELIKKHVKFSDIDLLSAETKKLVETEETSVAVKAIRAELGISQQDAEALIETIEKEGVSQ